MKVIQLWFQGLSDLLWHWKTNMNIIIWHWTLSHFQKEIHRLNWYRFSVAILFIVFCFFWWSRKDWTIGSQLIPVGVFKFRDSKFVCLKRINYDKLNTPMGLNKVSIHVHIFINILLFVNCKVLGFLGVFWLNICSIETIDPTNYYLIQRTIQIKFISSKPMTHSSIADWNKQKSNSHPSCSLSRDANLVNAPSSK